MATNVTSSVRTEPTIVNFWVQMCGCRFAMVAIANLQHAWTSSIRSLTVSLLARLAAIQVAIAVLIPTQTRLVPVECRPTLPRYEQNAHWFTRRKEA